MFARLRLWTVEKNTKHVEHVIEISLSKTVDEQHNKILWQERKAFRSVSSLKGKAPVFLHSKQSIIITIKLNMYNHHQIASNRPGVIYRIYCLSC